MPNDTPSPSHRLADELEKLKSLAAKAEGSYFADVTRRHGDYIMLALRLVPMADEMLRSTPKDTKEDWEVRNAALETAAKKAENWRNAMKRQAEGCPSDSWIRHSYSTAEQTASSILDEIRALKEQPK